MRKIYKAVACLFLLAACSKDNTPATLPDGSISFQYTSKDTIQVPVSILKDSAVAIGIQAALTGTTTGNEHWITFGADTTKIAAFRAKYGDAMLLPSNTYLFYKPTTRIPSGASVSDSAWLNIGQQTRLTEYSTYVLPVVIRSVDGSAEGAASKKVLYYVFKTGRPLFISKKGWTISAVSSQNGSSSPNLLLDDNNLTTSWTTNVQEKMPQWVTINLNRDITFSALTYYLPTAIQYPKNGGYPTSIKIETSSDGTTWTDKGTFAGNIKDNMQTISFGETTARYVRFTSLASAKYFNTYDIISISGIGLQP